MSDEALESLDSPEDIEQAGKVGWKAEADWKGDPPRGGFQTAKEFLDDHGKITKILKGHNEELLEKVSSMEGTMKLLVDDFGVQKSRAVAKEREAAEREKADLVAELTRDRKAAIMEGDVDKANNLDNQLDEVKAAPVPKGPSPDYSEWRTKNDWYSENGEPSKGPEQDEMSARAEVIVRELDLTGRYPTGKSLFDAVTARIKREYPDQFVNPNRDEPASVSKGNGTSTTEKEGYNDLPPEAKAACDQFIRDIPGFTKESYLETYEWD